VQQPLVLLELLVKWGIIGNSWFSSVKTAEAIYDCCHEWIGIVMTSHSLFLKKELEEKMQSWPGGMSLLMEATTLKGLNLIAIGYKYNSSKVLCFIATKNSGSTLLVPRSFDSRSVTLT